MRLFEPINIKKAKFANFFLSIAAGLILAASFPPLSFSLLSFFAFIPLFYLISKTSPKKSFLFSYLCGVIFFLISLYWLIKVTILGWIILCLYLGLYFAGFGLISAFFLSSYGGGKIKYSLDYRLLFILPSLWVGFEFLRAHLLSGFGWNSLGYSQFMNLALIQIADFSGVYGVSFIVMFINCILWLIFVKIRQAKQGRANPIREILTLLSILVLVLTAVLCYGVWGLKKNFRAQGRSLKLAIIQPNISQDLKWAKGLENFIIQRLVDLTQEAAAERPDMIIWPESALPIYLDKEALGFEEILQLARDLDIYILTGVVRTQDDMFYNSAILISPEARVTKTYDKLHLVPFGEFIPFRQIFPFLTSVVGIGDFTSGGDFTLFSLDKETTEKLKLIKFAVLVCFEDAFSRLSQQFVKKGAALLINITNDAWFDSYTQPQQHLSQSVFRAIENRVNIIRCANTGISGLINNRGRLKGAIKDKLGRKTFVSGFKTFRVDVPTGDLTLYTRYGDIFAYLCIALSLLAFFKKR